MTAAMTSSSSAEIVRTTTLVSGATPASFRVVSTPVSPGMFRSMITTSGASSPASWIAVWPFAASPTTFTPASSGFSACLSSVGVLLKRPPGGGCLSLEKSLVECDRHRAPAPLERLGACREPEVDDRALHGRARVRGDSLAVARDEHARPQGDEGRVDCDHAPTHRDPRRRSPTQAVAGRRDGYLAAALGRRAWGRCPSSAASAGGNLLRALLAGRRLGGQLRDLRAIEILLAAKADQVGILLDLGPRERGVSRLGLVERRPQLGAARGEAGDGRPQSLTGLRQLFDDVLVLLCEPVQPVEGGEGVVQGLCAEQDSERIDVTLDVELPQPLSELAVRRGHALARDCELALCRGLRLLEPRAAFLQRLEPLRGLRQSALERVEPQQNLVRFRRKASVVRPQC